MRIIGKILAWCINTVLAFFALIAVLLIVLAFTGYDTKPLISAVKGNLAYSQVAVGLADKFEAAQKVQVPEIKPEEGSKVVAEKTSFRFEGRKYGVRPAVDSAVYHGAVDAKRNVTTAVVKSPAAMKSAYYNAFVSDPEQASTIDSLCAAFRTIKAKRRFSSDEYAEFLAKYVQTLPYDFERASVDSSDRTLVGDPRFPIQTLADGTGDCDEKSFLLAALLKHEGYACAGLLFDKEKHMSVGIKSQGAGYDDTGYEFIETTGPSYISEVPEEFVGGVKLTSTPKVIVFRKSGKSYSASAVNDVALIGETRDSALAAAPAKKAQAEHAKNAADFAVYKAQYGACFTAYNTLQVTVKKDGENATNLKDRVSALAWIRRNAWWMK